MIADDTIRQEINELLQEEFELSAEQIHPEATLYEDLGLDSLDAVDMEVIMEKNFKVKLANQETIQEVQTIKDLHDLVIKLQKELLTEEK